MSGDMTNSSMCADLNPISPEYQSINNM